MAETSDGISGNGLRIRFLSPSLFATILPVPEKKCVGLERSDCDYSSIATYDALGRLSFNNSDLSRFSMVILWILIFLAWYNVWRSYHNPK